MTAVTIPLPARRRHRLLGTPPCELTLSVVTGEHQGRQIAIRAAKCTIGSAKGCTVRLVSTGISALHCWILRGSGGTIIRCRHPHTRLNGRPFRDAALMPGDRLQVGSVELEVQRCPLVPADWTVESADLPEATESPEVAYSAGPSASDFDARRAAQQLSELNDLVSRVSTERDALAQRLRTIEYEAASESDALKLAKENLELGLAASQQQLTELRGQVTARETEIESLRHAESRRVAEMQSRLEQALAERTALESSLRQEAAGFKEQSLSQQAECNRLQGECQRLEGQLAQLRELVGYTAGDRDRLASQLDGDQRRLIDQQQQIADEKSDLQQRYDQLQTELVEANRKLAVLEVQEDNHLQTEMVQTAQLKQRLASVEIEKTDLEARLAAQTAAWHDERESLRQQTLRVSDHSKNVEGQLGHVRELVESLAAERDKLCEQLEVTEMRLTAEQEQFQEERTAAQKQAQEQQAALDDWRRRAEASEQQLASAGEQLSQATVSFASLREESQSRLHDESGRAAQMAAEAHAMRERLLAVESQLADSETRLAVLQSESAQRLESEQRRTAELNERAAQLQQQLAASELQLTEAEHAFHAEGDSRLREAAAREAQLQQQLGAREASSREQAERLSSLEARLAETETRLAEQDGAIASRLENQREATADAQARAAELQVVHAALQSQYQELVETAQRERDAWNHDRQRIEGECRTLGQRLIEQQQKMEELPERAAAAAAQSTPGSMTLVLDAAQSDAQSDGWNEHQRAAHDAERRRLEERVAELESNLRDSQQFTQGMTLDAQQLASLAAESQPEDRSAELAQLQARLETLQGQLAEAQSWRGRCDEIQAQLAAEQAAAALRQAQVEQLQNELAAIANQPAPQPPAPPVDESAQLAALQAHEQACQEQQRALAQQRDAVVEQQNQLNQSREQYQLERDQLAQSQAEFENRCRQAEEALRAQEQLLNRQAEELSERLDSATSKLAEVEAQKAQLAEQQATLERQAEALLARQEELAQRKAAAAQEHSQPSASPTLPAAQDVAAEDRAAEVSTADDCAAEISSAESEREPLPEVPEHCASQFAASPQEDTPIPQPVWTPASTPPPPADDDSIEAYMFRLLKRVRGDTPPPPHPSAPPPPVQQPEPVAASPTAGSMPESTADATEPEQPMEYLPRNKAPELTTNLAAMREVANSAARNAIVKHQRRTGEQKALAQSIGAALTFGCAIAAAYFAWRMHSILAAIGATIGLVAGLYWGGKAVGHALGVMLLRVPASRDRREALPAGESQPAAENAPSPQSDGTSSPQEPDAVSPAAEATADPPADGCGS
jgi:chromosome segregation ATPase